MSKVHRGDKRVRPEWDYTTSNSSFDTHYIFLEMLESVRNVCEQVRDEIEGLRQDLKKRKRRRR